MPRLRLPAQVRLLLRLLVLSFWACRFGFLSSLDRRHLSLIDGGPAVTYLDGRSDPVGRCVELVLDGKIELNPHTEGQEIEINLDIGDFILKLLPLFLDCPVTTLSF